jgi:predicted transcriptional regulator
MPTNVVEGSTEALECIGFGRRSLDLIVDSLNWHVHRAESVLEELENQGLIKRGGERMQASLMYELTEAGRTHLLSSLNEQERSLLQLGLAADDAAALEEISRGTLGETANSEAKWEVGATRIHLWEAGFVSLSGLIRSRLTLTPKGREALESVKQLQTEL